MPTVMRTRRDNIIVLSNRDVQKWMNVTILITRLIRISIRPSATLLITSSLSLLPPTSPISTSANKRHNNKKTRLRARFLVDGEAVDAAGEGFDEALELEHRQVGSHVAVRQFGLHDDEVDMHAFVGFLNLLQNRLLTWSEIV